MTDILNTEAPIATQSETPSLTSTEQKPVGGWYESIADESLRGYVESKGFNAIEDLIKSYKANETLLGDNVNHVKVPKSDATPEEFQEFYDKVGRPKDAKDYTLEGEEGFTEHAKQWLHEAGLTQHQASLLNAKLNEFSAAKQAEMEMQSKQRVESELNDIKKEWNTNYDKNVELARRAARALGMDSDKLNGIQNAIGVKEMLNLFHKIGSGFKEDTFVDGSSAPNNFGMSVEAARAKIQEYSTNKALREAYLKGDPKAKQEMETLHMIIAGGGHE